MNGRARAHGNCGAHFPLFTVGRKCCLKAWTQVLGRNVPNWQHSYQPISDHRHQETLDERAPWRLKDSNVSTNKPRFPESELRLLIPLAHQWCIET